MLFSSNTFLYFFLPLVLGLYFVSPRAARNSVLLAASLIFYAWGETTWVLVMLASILFNWGIGRLLGDVGSRAVAARKRILVVAVVGNLAVLGFFKYGGFLVENINRLLEPIGAPQLAPIEAHLPLGISFFTFHALSYVIDVYRGTTPHQRRLDTLALYICLFPQLIAGPIIRYGHVHEQLARRTVTLDDFTTGVTRFVQGLGKKVLIANPVGAVADAVFSLPADERGVAVAWVGIIAYTVQIYFDFSGYSCMAIGLARMFGFRFRENFEHPYIASSMQDFWRRWHISLSSWFRDYLYIPLGGNRGTRRRTFLNLYLVFLLCGLWHGASWAFVAWGLVHGTFLALERTSFGAFIHGLPRALRHTYVLVAVLMAWVLFRAATIGDAVDYYGSLFGLGGAGVNWDQASLYLDHYTLIALVLGIAFSAPLRAWLVGKATGMSLTLSRWLRPALVTALFGLCAIQLAAQSYNPFIYFRF